MRASAQLFLLQGPANNAYSNCKRECLLIFGTEQNANTMLFGNEMFLLRTTIPINTAHIQHRVHLYLGRLTTPGRAESYTMGVPRDQ